MQYECDCMKMTDDIHTVIVMDHKSATNEK